MRVDLINVLAEFAALLSLDFLYLLEAAGLHECTLGLDVRWENLSELSTDVCKDVVWCKIKEWLESREMSAHLDDVLKRLLGLILEVLRALWKHVDGKESCWYISFGKSLSMIWGVATNLAKRPGGGSLQVVLWLVKKGLLEWGDTFGNDNSHGKGVIEGRDVTEGHDTWKSGIAL